MNFLKKKKKTHCFGPLNCRFRMAYISGLEKDAVADQCRRILGTPQECRRLLLLIPDGRQVVAQVTFHGIVTDRRSITTVQLIDRQSGGALDAADGRVLFTLAVDGDARSVLVVARGLAADRAGVRFGHVADVQDIGVADGLHLHQKGNSGVKGVKESPHFFFFLFAALSFLPP